MHSAGAARGHVMHDPAWPRPASAAHGGTTPVHGKRPRSGGSPVRERRMAAQRRRARLRLGRRWCARGGRGGGGAREASGAGEAAVGRRAARARRLSGRAECCLDSGFKPRRRHGTWRPCGSGALLRGPARQRFLNKQFPRKKNSSKQISRD
jgi:hypothetical protein